MNGKHLHIVVLKMGAHRKKALFRAKQSLFMFLIPVGGEQGVS